MEIETAKLMHRTFLAGISGVLLTAGFPDVNFSVTAWFGLVFLFAAIRDLQPITAFYCGIFTGFIHFVTMLYWIVHTLHVYGYLPLYLSTVLLILLVFYLSLYVGGFAFAVNRLCHHPFSLIFVAPLVWVIFEYMRSYLFTGFPWGLLGYTQYRSLWLIQSADIWGVYGISYLIVFANAVLFVAWLYFRKLRWQGVQFSLRQIVIASTVFIGVMALVLVYGRMRFFNIQDQMAESGKVEVALIQGNISQDVKWNNRFQERTINTYIDLSASAAEHNPDIIIWPETAVPFYFGYDQRQTDILKDHIRKIGRFFLFGAPTVEFEPGDPVSYYNSAYLLGPAGTISDRYDKVHLVPYGEYVPFKKWVPFINNLVAQVGDFTAGNKGSAIEWEKSRLGTLICYEIIFPYLSASMVQNGADILINLTNDAWFGNTSAPYQHFSMAVFRAVENRRPLVRAANTGISGNIDPLGRILSATGLFESADLVESVHLISEPPSFYTRYGFLWAWGCFIAFGIIIVIKLKFKNNCI